MPSLMQDYLYISISPDCMEHSGHGAAAAVQPPIGDPSRNKWRPKHAFCAHISDAMREDVTELSLAGFRTAEIMRLSIERVKSRFSSDTALADDPWVWASCSLYHQVLK